MKRRKPLRSKLETLRRWKRRSKPLKRGKPPKRRTRVRPVNPEKLHRKRGGKPGSRQRHTYGVFHFWIRHQPCELTGERGEHIDGHHLVPVGRGGRDHGNEIPLRHDLHMRLEQEGAGWLPEGVDLGLAARRWGKAWDALPEAERKRDRLAEVLRPLVDGRCPEGCTPDAELCPHYRARKLLEEIDGE